MITIIHGDITQSDAGAIVNAANTTLLGGGGVDGAIHRAAGPSLMAECVEIPATKSVRCNVSQAVITAAGELKSKYVIHTVGPRGSDVDRVDKLRLAYRNCLELAIEYGCQSIAFPAISTGVYGYPKDEALAIAKDECSKVDLDVRLYFL